MPVVIPALFIKKKERKKIGKLVSKTLQKGLGGNYDALVSNCSLNKFSTLNLLKGTKLVLSVTQ